MKRSLQPNNFPLTTETEKQRNILEYGERYYGLHMYHVEKNFHKKQYIIAFSNNIDKVTCHFLKRVVVDNTGQRIQ